MMKFQRYIGIDYSGAQTPTSRLKALQVFETTHDGEPLKVSTPTERARNWTRLEIAQYCLKLLQTDELVIIGIDHGFSFPLSYMQRYGITDWDIFLDDFILESSVGWGRVCVCGGADQGATTRNS